MQQQLVALVHRREDLALRQRRRPARGELGEAQFRPVQHVNHRHQPLQVHRAVQAEELVLGQVEALPQEAGQVLRALLAHLQLGGGAAKAPAVQFAAQGAGDILHLRVRHFQVGIAGDAELMAFAHRHAGEELIDKVVDDGGQEDEVVPLRQDGGGDFDEPRQGAGRRHYGQAALPPEGVLAVQLQDEVQALVDQAGEGMGRVQPQGADDRQDFILEVALGPVNDGRAPLVAVQELNALAP